MLHPSFHRLTTLVLLLVYVAANTIGGLFHDHADGRTHAHAGACQHGSDHDAAPGEHDNGAAGLAIQRSHGEADDDDGCAVCRFVGQRPMPAQSCSLGTLCQLCVELTVQHLLSPSIALEGAIHSRAPPLVRV
jgi:hypothetical protein